MVIKLLDIQKCIEDNQFVCHSAARYSPYTDSRAYVGKSLFCNIIMLKNGCHLTIEAHYPHSM